ncbi:MAG TPA: F0F1 ATP synthase subunit gamma, partial [Acetobacteraceae bacterium]|nr:F0F1 ATP synthase subunit gamma [Acetobacteraceae bacterium]
MASLKALRGRINSVKSTRKITSAMKMVAASKLKRAQNQAEAARPYAERMQRMLAALAASAQGSPTAPRMLVGTGQDRVHLLVVVTADRGLAGAFNTNVGRAARDRIRALEQDGKVAKVITVGRKGRDYLRREFANRLVGEFSFAAKKRVEFADVNEVAERVTLMLEAGEFDVCTVIYNRFESVIRQVPTENRLIPLTLPEAGEAPPAPAGPQAQYEFEPDEEAILAALLPRNMAIQLFRALIESAAGEQGARMAAMDNATRNAGEMINRLTLNYNRTRQANITKELIEIISGAEAV